MPVPAEATFRRRQIERALRAIVTVALALLLAGSFTGVVPRHDAPSADVERR